MRGDAFARGGAVGKVTHSLGHRYTSELWQVFKHWSSNTGRPFPLCGRLLPSRPTHLPRGPVAPTPGVPVYLRTSAGGRVCWPSLLPDGDPGPPKPVRNTPACVGKVSGWAGRLGVSSPGPRLSGAALSAVSSRSPPSCQPFLPRRGPAIGVAASGRRERTRDAAAVAPRGERRARPSCPCGPGGLSHPSCAQRPGAPASSPAATGTGVPLAWPELGARPAQGAATCSGRRAELGSIRRGPTRADPRPPLCLLLRRPWCPQPVDALNLREGCSPGTERGAGTF